MKHGEYLGYKAKDKVTGFEGTIIAHVKNLTSCDQMLQNL